MALPLSHDVGLVSLGLTLASSAPPRSNLGHSNPPAQAGQAQSGFFAVFCLPLTASSPAAPAPPWPRASTPRRRPPAPASAAPAAPRWYRSTPAPPPSAATAPPPAPAPHPVAFPASARGVAVAPTPAAFPA